MMTKNSYNNKGTQLNDLTQRQLTPKEISTLTSNMNRVDNWRELEKACLATTAGIIFFSLLGLVYVVGMIVVTISIIF